MPKRWAFDFVTTVKACAAAMPRHVNAREDPSTPARVKTETSHVTSISSRDDRRDPIFASEFSRMIPVDILRANVAGWLEFR
jgi:hypothetical protein